jgi:acyl-coenzyme A thioesterase PaaI-like protein
MNDDHAHHQEIDGQKIDEQEIDGTRAVRRQLAHAVRALVADIVDRDLSRAVALDLVDGVDDLRRRSTGSTRPRYYDPTLVGSPSDSFLDFSPISGRSHPWALPMSIEPDVSHDGTPGVRARLRIGLVHEGPPHGVHGGVMAAVFDELLGHAQQVHGMHALTASLTVRYRAVTPVDEDLELFAQIVPGRGRRSAGRAWCTAGGTVTAEAEAVFVGADLGAIAVG